MSTEVRHSLIIVGAGGHAKVVCEAAQSINKFAFIEVRDDDPLKNDIELLPSIFIKSPIGDLNISKASIHVAIGNNAARALKGNMLQSQNLFTVVHPKAIVSPYAKLHFGVFVAANAIVGAGSVVYNGAIVNHAAIVDHDCQIGAWSHIAPNVTLGGGVFIGEGVLIGAGAVVLPKIRIGPHAIVGAGAVVTKDVLSKQIVCGIPAKPMRVEECMT